MSPALLWFIGGFILILAEFVTPGFILVFLGLGAWVASLAVRLGWADTLGAQTAVFAGSSLVLLLMLRRWFKSWFLGFSQQAVTAGALEEYVGKSVRVITTVAPGLQGKVEFKGAQWNAEASEELLPGATGVITDVDGLCLRIRPQT
ncbi:MAG TPA: NfeD family protein [Prosthecobacter sp.]|nr:NfeD family protein [Prosthecobacter sp.]